MIHKQSIKTADLDSITFRRPANPNGLNIPGPNVTDIDGNTYQSVTNCGLTFTKQNLNVSKYTDGTPIPQVQDPTQWANLTTGAWCYYNNDTANGVIYGKLYNWYAVAGIYDAASAANPALRKKLAPTGWHVPSDAEWSSLINCLDPNADGGYNVNNIAGEKIKATGTIQEGTGLWSNGDEGTNESGLAGLPGGYVNNFGLFCCPLQLCNWWSSTDFSVPPNLTPAYYIKLDYSDAAQKTDAPKRFGFSVRFIRD
jgi:uncharacterized protein (TIGR02145 family)